MVYPHEEPGRWLAEIQRVADDFRARLADDVAGRLLVPGRIDEMTDAKPENRAVGQELVQISVREAGWLLGLYFASTTPATSPPTRQTMSGFSTARPASSR